MLPVKGCHVDPAEVVFAAWKRYMRKKHREYEDGVMDIAAIRRETKWWMKHEAPAVIGSAFKLRADGGQLFKLGLLKEEEVYA